MNAIQASGAVWRRLFWALVLILSGQCVHRVRAGQDGNFLYTTLGTNAILTGYTGQAEDVTIPAQFEGLPLTTIHAYAFNNASYTKRIVVPDSVRTVEDFAFNQCYFLTNLVIGKQVETFAPQAIASCVALARLTVAAENPFFYDLDGVLFTRVSRTLVRYPVARLSSYTVPEDILAIGPYAFNGAASLNFITFPAGLQAIGHHAFYYCPSLLDSVLGAGVTNIGPYALGYCPALKRILVDEANPAYASVQGVLYDKALATLVQYPGGRAGTNYIVSNTVTRVAAGAFYNCQRLIGVSLPEGVTEIGDSAFAYLSELKRVNVPAAVTNLGAEAFLGCRQLKSLSLPEGLKTIGDGAFKNLYAFTNVTLPNSLVTLGADALVNCWQLTNVVVGAGLKTIGLGSFRGCSQLDRVVFRGTPPAIGNPGGPESLFDTTSQAKVYYFPRNAGWGATYAGRPTVAWQETVPFTYEILDDYTITITGYTGTNASLVVPDTIETMPVTRLAANAFNGCAALVDVTLPATVVDLGENAFANCGALATVFFSGNAPAAAESVFANSPNVVAVYPVGAAGWGSTFAGRPTTVWMEKPPYLYEVTPENTITIKAYTGSEKVVVIPQYIKKLPVTALQGFVFGFKSVVSVTVPDRVLNVGAHTFDTCYDMTNVVLGAGVTNIGEFAFADCDKLTRVKIPNQVRTLGTNAFYWCQGLKEVEFGDNLQSIGSQAFFWCTNLTQVHLPDSVTNLGSQAFYVCRSLTNINLPANLTAIGASTFLSCVKLSNVDLGTNVVSIGPSAFYNTGITQAFVAKTVNFVGSGAFGNCSQLRAIVVDPENPHYTSAEGVLFNREKRSLLQYPGGKTGAYTVPAGVTNIATSAFAYLTNPSGLTLPEGLRSLDDSSLFRFLGVTNLSLPASLDYVGDRALAACGFLTNITVDPANARFSSRDGVLFNKEQTVLLQFPSGRDGSYQIPYGVTNTAYLSCAWSKLNEVMVPSTMTEIGDSTFFNSPWLQSVYLPASVTSLGSDTFSYCSGLTGVYFEGNAPELVNVEAFYNATNAVAYLVAGTTGWGSDYGGLRLAYWQLDFERWAALRGLPERFPQECGETDDPDIDGLANALEMRAGTDPGNAASVLAFESEVRPADLSAADQLPLAEGQFALYFQSVPGKTYSVWRADEAKGQWIKVKDFDATTTQKRVVLERPASAGFYRVSVAN